jgi:hypothetical protein
VIAGLICFFYGKQQGPAIAIKRKKHIVHVSDLFGRSNSNGAGWTMMCCV